jgi:hypothetical protein
MHRAKSHEIIQAAEIACAIEPLVQKHGLTVDPISELLTQFSVPRANSSSTCSTASLPYVETCRSMAGTQTHFGKSANVVTCFVRP